jgi:hypothetical protein
MWGNNMRRGENMRRKRKKRKMCREKEKRQKAKKALYRGGRDEKLPFIFAGGHGFWSNP